MTSRLTRNAAECRSCGAVIESKHRHDFVVHECGAGKVWFFVDGGLAYSRGGGSMDQMIDRSEYEEV